MNHSIAAGLLLWAGIAYAQTWEDRALAISREIQERHIPFGTVLNPMYTSPESDVVQGYTRCGDSAIWTGHWLAAESFRYSVTRSPDALEAARRALRGVQLLVDVTGSEDLLARCALAVESPWNGAPRNEERAHGEYRGSFGGTDYYWIGNTSRDQYMGVFFGLSVAYEHLDDPASRVLITDLSTRLIDRLLAKDWAVTMPGGKLSTVFWLRPDQQLAILQVGRQVNPSRFSAVYDDRRRSASGLDTIMSLEASEPHESYFKFNLAAISWYNLLRLEEAGSPKRSAYVDAYRTFRRAVASHGNAFFNVVDRALMGPDVHRDLETAELMSAWLLRPRRDGRVDLRGKYAACGDDRACKPIPVEQRVRTDFLWQRSPFLLYGGGEGTIEGPGIDFILPYWMGRYYGMNFGDIVVSSASNLAPVAPGSYATLYAAGLTSGAVRIQDAAGAVREAEVIYSGPGQINFLVPPETAVGVARVLAGDRGVAVDVQRVAPALFTANATGKGPAAAVAFRTAADGSRIEVKVFHCSLGLCFADPIELRRNETVYVSLYGTGIRNAIGPVTARVDDEPVQVLYAGPQPEFAGLDQVNIRLDSSLPVRGERSIVVSADGTASQPVRILLK